MRSGTDEFQRMREWEARVPQAQARAALAYRRLVAVAEQRDTGQARHVEKSIAGNVIREAPPFDLFELRALDVSLAGDELACIDALRWAKADLHKLLPDGEHRIAILLTPWGLNGN